ncbi:MULTISPECIES: molecular chaperone HtpG [Micromonospora]|uniref:Chaperone protein HtpG n=1 Tax=Micromonospora rifamycinica TaxID=291594 RepID=A0A1C5H9C8_9ACTN|nr:MULTISPECIES: molecular chaperone HtpG [Micromonospora]WFE65699.1 molecular chaperone HtpG [Micromonospora sp. WMMD714]SCG42619.1 molecular chaperone HtpG [Micromonospora rifamycinica]
MSTRTETLEFQAETRQLLHLMVHSIYSHKDVFLRELISNASDALDKLRLESLVDSDLDVDTSDLHIELVADPEARTLTIRDNGIGMSREDVVSLIGTIARSGTAELLRKLKESKENVGGELIGQFGVGFYSTFMVADRVTLLTRRAGQTEGTRWESTGEGTYVVETVDDAPQGTSVTVHLKPADDEDSLHDYTDRSTIREIVKRYSDFIAWPIRTTVPGVDGGEPTVETLNSRKALWARSRDEVAEEEYREFYRHVSHDWTDPLETIHMRGEGTFEYEALLFLPAHAPYDLYQADGRRGVQLYVKRVFVMDDCAALMPSYLRFVRGVVDAHDLSLNISREILQQDRQIQIVRRRLVRKVLGTVKEMRAGNPERFATFWSEFGRVVKEGLLEDADNTETILDLVTVSSTHHATEPTTLGDYVARMKEGQGEIYYATGENRTMLENSPHLEAFRAKGYEVLLLTDPVDEVWVERVGQFDGKPLRSIAKGQVDLETEEERKATEVARDQQNKEYATLLTFLGEALSETVKEVRLSSRLTTSPACIVGDANDITPTLEKMYRAMGQELPSIKRILELNPTHPLVTGLRAAHQRGDDLSSLTEAAELLYGTALLAEGGDLADPARFARLLADRLARTL